MAVAGTTTSRRGSHGVETVVAGRATGETIRQMVDDFVRFGGGETWLIDAGDTTSYSAEAVERAVHLFGDLSRDEGLTQIVAYIEKPTVRMGAAVVSMSLRAAGSRLQIEIVDQGAFAAMRDR
jgi:hypothetical protein